MTTRMLIDGSHEEETRVALLKDNKVEDFDFESASRKQLRGNIYLAKVTRVEPSLQACFVDYGGNRHGFLAFSEIHPDYFQLPIADRQRLAAEQERATSAEEGETEDEPEPEPEDAAPREADTRTPHAEAEEAIAEIDARETPDAEDEDAADHGPVESIGADDDLDEAAERRAKFLRRYKIQEVIKRRQILLVQVVKEERGTKGAALTTYISLPGRYCVLMPNTGRGGGISRKIASTGDRKRLKSVVMGLDVPDGMGVIIRTAGANRTKAEIKRDYDYLLRLWDEVRERTLKSIAPTLVYEEGDLIKRSIRDLYTRDIGEILVEGEEAYRAAKDFMRSLMPSHAKKVQPYRDQVPLFTRHKIEHQLDSMFESKVELPSGGYIVIDQTEALVAIDVNSGRATREHNIEETAYRTNLEAVEEIGRQLRLRDMAGLIVIDLIDMDDRGNIRSIERRLKDALKNDRARIQVGRISPFGLLEMSRQRLRTGMLEASTRPCPHCHGAGFVRSTDSTALHILRLLEEEGLKQSSMDITLHVPTDVAIYLLNQKRREISALEGRYDLTIDIEIDPALVSPEHRLNRKRREARAPERETVAAEPELEPELEPEPEPEPEEMVIEEKAEAEEEKPRRRRRKRKPKAEAEAEPKADEPKTADSAASAEEAATESEEEHQRKRRRRGRRGGRRRVQGGEAAVEAASETAPVEAHADKFLWQPGDLEIVPPEGTTEALADGAPTQQDEGIEPGVAEMRSAVLTGPVQENREIQPSPEEEWAPKSTEEEAEEEEEEEEEAASGPPAETRRGWWQRRFGG